MSHPFRVWRERARGGAAAAMLALIFAPVVYFLPAVRGERVLCPEDGILFNVPLRFAAAQITSEHHWPLWNPFIFSGMPLLGAAQGGLLLPFNWFFLFFDARVATNLMVLATFAVAGVGAFLYARRSGASLTGALVTGLVWQWSGFLVAQVGHTNVVQTASLLPLMLWAMDGFAMTGRRAWGALLALLVALATFAGHQQTLVYALMLAGAYALYMAFRSGDGGSERARGYLWSLLFVVAGVALAAVQILPTLELLRNSVRAEASYEFFTSFSLPPKFLLTFLAPYVLGGGDGTLFRAPYTGPEFYGEYIGYVGLAALTLALVAWPLRRADARTRFWAVAALVALALALGRFWPFDLYRLAYYVPVLNLFRVPSRHMMEVDFALAVLAGRGLTFLVEERERGRTRATLLVCAGSVCVFLLTWLVTTALRPRAFHLGREAPATFLRAPELFMPFVLAAASAWLLWRVARGGRAATVLLVAFIVFDLALWGQMSGWCASSPRWEDQVWQTPPVVETLRTRAGESFGRYRILTFTDALKAPEQMQQSSPAPGGFVWPLQPDAYMLHRFQNAAGYDGFGLARYSRLAGDMKVWGDLTEPRRSLYESRELDLLNVRYLVARRSRGALPEPLPATEKFGDYLFAAQTLDAPYLDKGARIEFAAPPTETTRIALVSNLSWSVDLPDGARVGRVRLRTQDERVFEFELRAGLDTAEWAYERPQIRRRIRHARAPVASSFNVEDREGDYQGYNYVASFQLPERATITGGEIEVATVAEAPQLGLSVSRLSLVDETTGRVVPLRKEWLGGAESGESEARKGEAQGATRWRRIAELSDTVIYENTRALPRAWLAVEAATQPDEATLETIRKGTLADGRTWDPARTALLDTSLPQALTGGDESGQARVTRYEPNRVDVLTTSTRPSVLVLAENHYPGWRAYVDGRAVETLRVDYNLRGVLVDAGQHEVKFIYRPKSVLLGLLLTLLTALALAAWWRGWLPEERALRLFSKVTKRHSPE